MLGALKAHSPATSDGLAAEEKTICYMVPILATSQVRTDKLG